MQRGRHMNEYAALFLFAALMGLLGQTLIPWPSVAMAVNLEPLPVSPLPVGPIRC